MNHRIVSYIFLSVLAGSLFAQAGNPPARPAGTRPLAPAPASPSATAPAQNPASPTAVVRPETIKTVYVTINASKQGVLGKGKIRLLKYDFQASAPLLQALETNENLNTVTFEFMSVAADNREQPAFTIKLTNATVSHINQSVDASGPGSPGGLEEVHFTYQKLDFQDLFNRSAAEISHEGSF